MKKQFFALVLLSILVLTLITGCTKGAIVEDAPTGNEITSAEEEVVTSIETDLIGEDDTIELGELI
jgi:hypothetical protein